VDPISLSELEAVVEVWADSALCLTVADLKLMKRLVEAQTRLAA
jgi:DSF synthase